VLKRYYGRQTPENKRRARRALPGQPVWRKSTKQQRQVCAARMRRRKARCVSDERGAALRMRSSRKNVTTFYNQRPHASCAEEARPPAVTLRLALCSECQKRCMCTKRNEPLITRAEMALEDKVRQQGGGAVAACVATPTAYALFRPAVEVVEGG